MVETVRLDTELRGSIGKPLVVQKYGGSSVATAEHLKRVATRVVDKHEAGNAVVVVVSAMGKTTDSLVELARSVSSTPERREMDLLLHAGEVISAAALAMAITEAGVRAIALTGQQAGMQTDASHTKARIQSVQADRVLSELARGSIVVVTGFQGVTASLEITTLGRGGSDTSAVAMAVGLRADACEILTDVDGVYTADPRVVKQPQRLEWCSYDAMLELASLGAKVLHSRSVEIARRFKMPIVVATSFRDVPGTVICSKEYAQKELGFMEEVSLRGISHRRDVAKVSLVGVPDQPGVAAKVFGTLAAQNVNVVLIVQAEHHGGTNDIAFLCSRDDLEHVRGDLDGLQSAVGADRVLVDERLATVSVVGEGVQHEPGIAATMFDVLGAKNINIDLISTSNLMLTCVIPEEQSEGAAAALHEEFFEGQDSR